ncbi:MAG: nucleotidyltransferase domain-containing protein [Actinomycetota bacterium]
MKYRRLNITLPEDTLARADAFAKAERYSRSALIAEALEAFVGGEGGGASVVREAGVAYAPEAVGLNPALKPLVPAIIEACRRHGAVFAALVGSSTQPDPAIVPRDVDLLVRFSGGWESRADRYFGLREDLSSVTGRSVDLIEIDAVKNPLLREEFERTRVVLLEIP